MANSDSEDFESADEEVSKSSEFGKDYEKKATNLSTKEVSDVKPMTIFPTAFEGKASEFSDDLQSKSHVPTSTLLMSSPERLGAKPKVFQGSNPKHLASKGTTEGCEDVDLKSVSSSTNVKGDTKLLRKHGRPKLGVRVQKSSLSLDETSSFAPLSGDSSRLKEKSRGRVTWSLDVTDDCTEEQSVQPLLEKLASVDMSEDQIRRDKDELKCSSSDHSSGWGSWGSWGVSTILSGASTVTNHVTQSLSNVTSAIETGLGAVGPEEMARISVEDNKVTTGSFDCDSGEVSSGPQCEAPSSSGLLSVGNVLRFMESTGGMIVASGLNTLETIGKKTMDVLQEGDPGLKRKRAFLSRESDRPSLSQVLKEARLKAEFEDKERAKLKKESKPHFETLFDDYRGMVHLEALEMLSHTCQMKLEAKHVQLSGPQLIDFQRTLAHIKELCEIPDEDDEDDDEDRGSPETLEKELAASMKGLMVSVSYAKLIRISEDTDTLLNTMKCLNEDEVPSENDEWAGEDHTSDGSEHRSSLQEIHQQAIHALAQYTAAVTEHFHKTAELLLLKEEHHSELEARSLVMMTTALCSRVSSVAARFSELLSATANVMTGVNINHNNVNSLITNVFLEASNSSSYIQDASNLLIPVLQLGAVH